MYLCVNCEKYSAEYKNENGIWYCECHSCGHKEEAFAQQKLCYRCGTVYSEITPTIPSGCSNCHVSFVD